MTLVSLTVIFLVLKIPCYYHGFINLVLPGIGAGLESMSVDPVNWNWPHNPKVLLALLDDCSSLSLVIILLLI